MKMKFIKTAGLLLLTGFTVQSWSPAVRENRFDLTQIAQRNEGLALLEPGVGFRQQVLHLIYHIHIMFQD